LLIKLIVGMALIGGIAVALARSMKNRPLRPTRNMEILATIAIDSRCMVHLVRSGTRRLLVGLDPSGIKTLTELPASAVPFALTQPGIAYQPLAGEVDLGGPESTSRRD
jgi:flagellar biogenesis protein FliO